jgi:hypothetical protein
MFSVFLGTEGVDAGIFTNMDEAQQWLVAEDRGRTGGSAG